MILEQKMENSFFDFFFHIFIEISTSYTMSSKEPLDDPKRTTASLGVEILHLGSCKHSHTFCVRPTWLREAPYQISCQSDT